jgi:D-arabinan endo alpha-(1,5)-arabinofuranosidase
VDVARMGFGRRRFMVGAGGALLGLGLGTGQALAAGAPRQPGAAKQLGATQIARLTAGRGTVNRTDTTWGVSGTELGHTFLYRGLMAMVFGNTSGEGDSRGNAMGWINPPHSPDKGLILSGMVTDRPGHAKELLAGVIPTFGVAVRDRLVLHYKPVKNRGQAGLAYSDDLGQTWTKDTGAVWPGDSNFGQVAITESAGHLYFFGIPGARYGGVQLARVRPGEILAPKSYEYWDGTRWAPTIAAAATIVPPNVGELSVRWNSHYKRWLMMYVDQPAGQILLRTARQLVGPWSAPKVVTTSAGYAPYITPLWNDGPDIYFTMSVSHGVDLLRTSLGGAAV